MTQPETPQLPFDISELLAKHTIRDVVPVYTITPDMALKLLELNHGNRKKRTGNINRMIEDMKEGRWYFLGDPLVFDKSGRLRSGQHRLFAIVETGTSQDMAVVTDVPDEAFPSIDTGLKRSSGDQLHIATGAADATLTAAIIPRYALLKEGKGMNHCKGVYTWSATRIVSWYQEHPELHERFVRAASTARHININVGGTPSILGALYMAAGDINEADAFEFFHRQLVDKRATLTVGDPALRLAEYLMAYRAGSLSRKHTEDDLVCAVKQCWNAFRKGQRKGAVSTRMKGKIVDYDMI